MELWLVHGGDRLRFPITPFVDIARSINNTTENLNEVGTINIAGKPGLRTTSISSFFPAQNYPFLTSNSVVTDPYYYDRKISQWATLGEPLRLILTETPHNFEVLINSYTSGERDGTGDVHFDLDLSEYVRVEATEVPQMQERENPRLKDEKGNENTRLKTPGKYDTPWTMAKKLTGNGENYKKLMQKNKIGIADRLKSQVLEL